MTSYSAARTDAGRNNTRQRKARWVAIGAFIGPSQPHARHFAEQFFVGQACSARGNKTAAEKTQTDTLQIPSSSSSYGPMNQFPYLSLPRRNLSLPLCASAPLRFIQHLLIHRANRCSPLAD